MLGCCSKTFYLWIDRGYLKKIIVQKDWKNCPLRTGSIMVTHKNVQAFKEYRANKRIGGVNRLHCRNDKRMRGYIPIRSVETLFRKIDPSFNYTTFYLMASRGEIESITTEYRRNKLISVKSLVEMFPGKKKSLEDLENRYHKEINM